MQRFARGTLVGTGALHGLGRAAAFASTAFIGGAGLTYAIRSSIKQATDQTQILANLRNSLQAAGFSWREYGARIQDATAKTKAASAFDDEALYQSLQLLIRGTGDVNKALKLNALAADVARGRNLGLVQSAQLLVRVNAGQIGSLRRLGIQVDKNATGAQALAQVQRQYAGAAEAYGKTAAGVQARLTVAIEDTEKAIGRALLPTVVKLETQLADWLGKTKNQERVQRDVEAVLREGTKVVEGFAGAVRLVAPPVRDVTEALGGAEKAARDLLLLFAGWKVAGLLGKFRAVGAAAGEAGAAGQIGLLGSRLALLRAAGPYVIPIIITYELVKKFGPKDYPGARSPQELDKGGGLLQAFDAANNSFFSGIAADMFGKLKPGAFEKWLEQHPGVWQKQVHGVDLAQTPLGKKIWAAYIAGITLGPPAPGSDLPAARGLRPEGGGTAISASGGSALLGRRARIQQALDAAARTTKTQADDVKALTQLHVFLGQQIEAERKRLDSAITKKQAKKFADNLHSLEQQDASALGQIQSIEDQAAADAKAKADRIKAAAKRAADAKVSAAKKAVLERQRAAHADAQLALEGGGPLGVDVGKLERAAKTAASARAKARAAALSVQEGALSLARQAADLATARAGTNEALLAKATALAEKADRKLIAFYKERIKATKGLARQNYQQQLIQAQIDLAGLGKKAASSGGFTLAQLYAEAEQEYKMYGSNYGPDGQPLSPQGARAGLSAVVLNQGKSVHVTQIFAAPTRPSQAMNDARAGARYLN